MPSVFLSYAYSDSKVAEQLAENLKSREINVWIDKEQILAGDSIVDRIREGIQSADYLIVLLSEGSSKSSWVNQEIGVAFSKFGEEAGKAILPVRVDKSPLPESLQNIKYVDMTEGMDSAVNELLNRIKRDGPSSTNLNLVINSNELADDIASDRPIRRGREYYVTVILALLSILATLIAAWPSFQTAFGTSPKVFYDLKSEVISLPSGIDEKQVIEILRNAGIAPAVLRLRIVNKGSVAASEIKIGINTNGTFLYAITNPPIAAKCVWVQVVIDSFNKGDKDAIVLLKELVPEKPVILDFGYDPSESSYSATVVAAGILAERVSNIDLVPQWSFWRGLSQPILILIFGIFFSLIVGIVMAAKRNPRLRKKLFNLIEAIFPLVARIVRVFY